MSAKRRGKRGCGEEGKEKRAKREEEAKKETKKAKEKKLKNSPEKRDHRHHRHGLLDGRVPPRPRQVGRVEPDVRAGALRAPGGVVVEDEADEARLVRGVVAFGFAAALRGRREEELALLRPRGRGRGAVAAAAAAGAAVVAGRCDGEKKEKEKERKREREEEEGRAHVRECATDDERGQKKKRDRCQGNSEVERFRIGRASKPVIGHRRHFQRSRRESGWNKGKSDEKLG